MVLLSAFSGNDNPSGKTTLATTQDADWRGVNLTYDSIHSLLISPEDDDPAVFTDRDDLRAAAHDTSTGSVVARVTVCSRPLVSNRYGLEDTP